MGVGVGALRGHYLPKGIKCEGQGASNTLLTQLGSSFLDLTTLCSVILLTLIVSFAFSPFLLFIYNKQINLSTR